MVDVDVGVNVEVDVVVVEVDLVFDVVFAVGWFTDCVG